MANIFQLFGTIFIDNAEANKNIDSTTEKAEKSGSKIESVFSAIGKGAVALGTATVTGVAAAGAALTATAENTREYRVEMTKLDTAFVTSGFSANDAKNTYTSLYAVLGETDQAVEASSHLAKLCKTEEDLSSWTDICTGVFATFGSSLPIEGLTEAANETAKVGQLTGSLADALNWAAKSGETFGVKMKANTEENAEWNKAVAEATSAEDYFNLALQECSTEQERQSLIAQTLNGLYADAANTYKELNSDIIATNESQAKLTDASAKIGAKVEPLITKAKGAFAEVVLKALPMAQKFLDKLMPATESFFDLLLPPLTSLILTLLPLLLDLAESLLPSMIQIVSDILPVIADLLVQLSPFLVQIVSDVLPLLVSTISMALPLFSSIISGILPPLISLLLSALPTILQFAQILLPQIVQILSALIPAALQIIDGVLPLLLTLIESLLPLALQIVSEILPIIVRLIEQLLPPILEIVELILPTALILIESLMPLVASIVDIALPTLVTVLELLLPILLPLLELLTSILEPLTSLLNLILPPLISVVTTLTEQVLVRLQERVGLVTGFISGAFGEAVASLQQIIGNCKNIFENLISFVKNVFTGNWRSAWQNVVNIFKNLWEGLKTTAKWPINFVIEGLNTLIRGLNKISFDVPDWVPEIGGKTLGFDIPTIPKLRRGLDYVPRDDYPALLHKGERVLTASEAKAQDRAEANEKQSLRNNGSRVTVYVQIEHFHNESDRDINSLVDYVIEKIDEKIEREEEVFA